MPSQVLRGRRHSTLHRRPKRRLGLPGDVSFIGRNWSRRVAVWARAKLLMLAILLGLIWLGVHLATAPEYRITAITVKGSSLIKPDEVIQMADLRDRPILLANTRQAERSIAKLKAVRSVAVRLGFPNRSVIEIVEQPAAYIWKAKDTLYLASEDGIIVGTTTVVDKPVAIVDIEARDVATGDQIDADALRTAKALSGLLPKEMGLTPAYFEYSKAEGVVLPTDFAGRVVFGGSADLESKVATLKSLKQAFRDQKLTVKYVDLRFKDRPYFR